LYEIYKHVEKRAFGETFWPLSHRV